MSQQYLRRLLVLTGTWATFLETKTKKGPSPSGDGGAGPSPKKEDPDQKDPDASSDASTAAPTPDNDIAAKIERPSTPPSLSAPCLEGQSSQSNALAETSEADLDMLLVYPDSDSDSESVVLQVAPALPVVPPAAPAPPSIAALSVPLPGNLLVGNPVSERVVAPVRISVSVRASRIKANYTFQFTSKTATSVMPVGARIAQYVSCPSTFDIKLTDAVCS